jgi:hypothetical protein
MLNLETKVPEERWREVKGLAPAAYKGGRPMAAQLIKEDFAARYERELPSAVAPIPGKL